MGKISNMLTMIQLLSTGRKYSVDELSKELEITPRMVRFYKEELDKAGIYIDTIRGPYGGYVLKQNVRIPDRQFSMEDVQLLKKICTKLSEDNLQREFNYLISKVNGIYLSNKETSKGLGLKDETLLKYNVMERAIKEKRKVKIVYDSLNKGISERIIHPFNMFLYSNRWGVAGYCENRKDLRHFSLCSIKKYELLDEFYE